MSIHFVSDQRAGSHAVIDLIARCGIPLHEDRETWYEMSIVEIAGELGLCARSIKSCLTRARNKHGRTCGYYDGADGEVRAYLSEDEVRATLAIDTETPLEPRPRLPIRVLAGATSSSKAFVAELLSSVILSNRNPNSRAVVYGGTTRGHDVSAGNVQVNAKKLTERTPSEMADGLDAAWKLTRANGIHFADDVESALVRKVGLATVECDGRTVTIRVDVTDAEVAMVPSSQLNPHLHPEYGVHRVTPISEGLFEAHAVPWRTSNTSPEL